ncbi:MAG: hypothetical protein MJZ19_11290 [Paludibacteraceae bacterium]|nr:hypothetical protein [Paludibacteraceae bacterium]
MKSFLLGAFGLAFAVTAVAETGAKSGTKYGTGEDSTRCLGSLMAYQNMAKQKNYGSMHESWEILYNECPASSQRIYSDGAFMLKWEIQNAANLADKKAKFNDLMNLYDQRIKYFGKDKKYPTYYILGQKAINYCQYPELTSDKNNVKAYQWLEEAINSGESKCKPDVFRQFFILSEGLFKENPTANRQKFIDDYMKISPMISAAAESDSTYDIAKSSVDKIFARSGAAECGTLDKAYSAKIDANKTNEAFLNDVLALYAIADCKESAVYFKGSAYLHAIKPTASSAQGMAAQAYSKKDYGTAIKYYNEAISLTNDKSVKSLCYFNIATLQSANKNYEASRAAALKCLQFDPTEGRAYILIATLYASYRQSISDIPAVQNTAYWAACDKLEKAKSVDPGVASKANSLLSQYKQYFPDKSELFMRGINVNAGASYSVPGWINEKTTVRFK